MANFLYIPRPFSVFVFLILPICVCFTYIPRFLSTLPALSLFLLPLKFPSPSLFQFPLSSLLPLASPLSPLHLFLPPSQSAPHMHLFKVSLHNALIYMLVIYRKMPRFSWYLLRGTLTTPTFPSLCPFLPSFPTRSTQRKLPRESYMPAAPHTSKALKIKPHLKLQRPNQIVARPIKQ